MTEGRVEASTHMTQLGAVLGSLPLVPRDEGVEGAHTRVDAVLDEVTRRLVILDPARPAEFVKSVTNDERSVSETLADTFVEAISAPPPSEPPPPVALINGQWAYVTATLDVRMVLESGQVRDEDDFILKPGRWYKVFQQDDGWSIYDDGEYAGFMKAYDPMRYFVRFADSESVDGDD